MEEATALLRESGAIERETTDRLIRAEWGALIQDRAGWSLTQGPQDLELVAHALRCILHVGDVQERADEIEALAAVQRSDGGFSPASHEGESAVWVSAFCSLMLIRGNFALRRERLAEAVRHAIDYFLATQEADGRWIDPRWADLDTTSHPVSFFNVVLAQGESHRAAEVKQSWEAGLRFILAAQADDGGWYDADFHPSGVEITAHLIQDALIADVLLGDQVGVATACGRGLAKLVRDQAKVGSWDEDNVDHTMDCVRSSMLVARLLEADAPQALEPLGEARDLRFIERGLAWILAAKNDAGWGDFPGVQTNLERSCDGVDTLCKSRAFHFGSARDLARLWGYAR